MTDQAKRSSAVACRWQHLEFQRRQFDGDHSMFPCVEVLLWAQREDRKGRFHFFSIKPRRPS